MEGNEIERPATPAAIRASLATPISRPSTPSNIPMSLSHSQQHPLHPTQPITTPQQFHDWFALIEKSISHSQESHFRAYLAAMDSHLSMCDGMLERVLDVQGLVGEMLEDWKSVESGGRSLQGACERLLEERVSLFWFKSRLASLTDENLRFM